jgi:hypothetical protein
MMDRKAPVFMIAVAYAGRYKSPSACGCYRFLLKKIFNL